MTEAEAWGSYMLLRLGKTSLEAGTMDRSRSSLGQLRASWLVRMAYSVIQMIWQLSICMLIWIFVLLDFPLSVFRKFR